MKNINPPKRVDQTYKYEGSVASSDFQLSASNQTVFGVIIMNNPSRIMKINPNNIQIPPSLYKYITYYTL
jgi:hypothetical protein